MKTQYLRLVFIFFFLHFKSFGQSKIQESFVINGGINVDKGIVELVCRNPVDSGNFSKPAKVYSSEIQHNRFTINGVLDFPEIYSFRYIRNDSCVYVSDYFLVDSGIQTSEINTESSMPKLLNASMNDYYKTEWYLLKRRLEKDKKWFRSFSDSLKAVYPTTMPDSLTKVLAGIIANHNYRAETLGLRFYNELKDSYLALWVLYDTFYIHGFQGLDEYYFTALSEEIQQSSYGRQLRLKLNDASPTKVGAKFPLTHTYKNLKNNANEKITLTGNYTLVYFWWTRCGKCINEFSEFKNLYAAYSGKGFEIIHISDDNTGELPLLQKIRKKYNIAWAEYLDENGRIEKGMELDLSYPRSILVDKEGVILRKNMSTDELKSFLQKALL